MPQKLQPIEKHPGFYRDPKTELIYFRSNRQKHRKLNGGKQVKWSTDTTKISKAKELIEDRLASLGGEGLTKEQRKKKNVKNPSLESLWAELMETKHTKSLSTQRSYDQEWRIVLSHFWGDKHVSDITSQRVLEFEKWYRKEYRTRTFRNARKTLVMLFKYCKDQGYISTKPSVNDLDESIARDTKKKAVGRVYTDEELNTLLSAALYLDDKFAYFCILFGSRMGLRKAEFLNIRWSDIDFGEGTVEVWRKSKVWQELAVPKSLLKKLKEYQKAAKGEWVFQSPRGDGPVTTQVMDRHWFAVKKVAKIKDGLKKNRARIHDLRHTFATKTAEDNWNAKVACEYLDMSMKIYDEIYAHVDADIMRKLIDSSFGGELP